MAEREGAIRAFLERHGLAGARRVPLAGDASARRYERIQGGPRPAVLMDAPPGAIDVRPFLAVAAWLRAAGLSAPEVLAADAPAGLVLLEDLGDDLFSRVLAQDGDEGLLYRTAVDLLLVLHRALPPASLPPYDDAWLLREALLLVEWYAPEVGAPAKAEYRAIWRDLLPAGAHRRRRLRLRRLPRRQPALAARAQRSRAGRPARLPGRAPRPAGLRPRLAARGCPARRRPRPRPSHARALPRGPAGARPGRLPRRLRPARRPAQRQDPRPVRPPRQARRQAALPAAASRASERISSATCATPCSPRSEAGSSATCSSRRAARTPPSSRP